MRNGFGAMAVQPWNTATVPHKAGTGTYMMQIKYAGNQEEHGIKAEHESDKLNLTITTGPSGDTSDYVIRAGASSGTVRADTLDAVIEFINRLGMDTTSVHYGWKARRKDAEQNLDLDVANQTADAGSSPVSISNVWTDAIQWGTAKKRRKRLVNYDLAVLRPSDGSPLERQGLIAIGNIQGEIGSGTEVLRIMQDDGTVALSLTADSGHISTTSYFSLSQPMVLRGPVVIDNDGNTGAARISWMPVNP